LRLLFEDKTKEHVPDLQADNDALVATLQTDYYKKNFVEGLIEVIQLDGLTPDEVELITRVELQITENLMTPGETDGSKRMVKDPGIFSR
jgi:hypothetical protein